MMLFCDLYDLGGGPKSEETKRKMSKSAEYKKTKVIQYSINGEFIREWNSIEDAEQSTKILGISGNCRNKCYQSGNFIWRYKTENYPLNINPYKRISHRKKCVNQFDLNNNLIQIWDSILLAARFLNISPGDISRCCSDEKKKTAGGFKWKYKED